MKQIAIALLFVSCYAHGNDFKDNVDGISKAIVAAVKASKNPIDESKQFIEHINKREADELLREIDKINAIFDMADHSFWTAGYETRRGDSVKCKRCN